MSNQIEKVLLLLDMQKMSGDDGLPIMQDPYEMYFKFIQKITEDDEEWARCCVDVVEQIHNPNTGVDIWGRRVSFAKFAFVY